MENLLLNLRFIEQQEALRLARLIIDDLNPKTPEELQGTSRVLELLGQLTARAGIENKKNLTVDLIGLPWYSLIYSLNYSLIYSLLLTHSLTHSHT